MSRPIPFVQVDQASGSLQVTAEAAAQLQSIESPVCVLSIAGFQSSGKSFLLNKILGVSDGFPVASEEGACTQGIWMWVLDGSESPVIREHMPENTKLVILDSEGIPLAEGGNIDGYFINIFTLSLLLGSYFIYNDQKSIDEAAIERLNFIGKLSEIAKSQENTSGDKYDLKIFFPTFLWLVRDFAGELKVSGKSISAKEYMEGSLVPVRGSTPAIVAKNTMRNSIVQYFADRDCLTARSALDVDPEAYTTSDGAGQENFLGDLHVIRKKVYASLRPKALYGHSLSGSMFLSLTEKYIKSVNQRKPIVIKSSWEVVASEECQKGLGLAKAVYLEKFAGEASPKTVQENELLEKAHWASIWAGWHVLKGHTVGNEASKYEEEYLAFAHSTFNSKYSEYCNESASEITNTLQEFLTRMEDFVAKCSSTDNLEEEWGNVFDKYQRVVNGLAKDDIIANTAKAHPIQHAQIVGDKMVEDTRKQNQEKLLDFLKRADQDYARLEELHKNVEEKLEQSKQDKAKVIEDTNTINERTEALKKAKLEQESEKERALRELQSATQKNQELKANLDNLKRQLKEYQDSMSELNRSTQKTEEEKAQLEGRITDLQNRPKCAVM